MISLLSRRSVMPLAALAKTVADRGGGGRDSSMVKARKSVILAKKGVF